MRWQLNYWLHHEDWIEEIKERVKGRTRVDYGLATRMDPTRYGGLLEEATELAGGLKLHEIRSVYVPTGNEVLRHEHKSMRVMLYMLHDHPSMLGFDSPTEEVPTEEGYLVDVPQGRYHWVTKNLGEPRITIAFMFDAR